MALERSCLAEGVPHWMDEGGHREAHTGGQMPSRENARDDFLISLYDIEALDMAYMPHQKMPHNVPYRSFRTTDVQ